MPSVMASMAAVMSSPLVASMIVMAIVAIAIAVMSIMAAVAFVVRQRRAGREGRGQQHRHRGCPLASSIASIRLELHCGSSSPSSTGETGIYSHPETSLELIDSIEDSALDPVRRVADPPSSAAWLPPWGRHELRIQ
jgi:hypothetical protein